MRQIILATLLLLSHNLIGQEDLFDKSYGVSGTASLEVPGFTVFFNHYSIDSRQSVYLSGTWLNRDWSAVSHSIRRLDAVGHLEEWGIHTPLDTAVLASEHDYEFFWMENDKVYSYTIEDQIENNDTFRTVKRYDLSLNEEVSYRTWLPAFLGLEWFINDSAFMNYDNQGRLYVRDIGSIKRYAPDGTLDTTFGEEGSLTVYDLEPRWSLGQTLYNDLEIIDDNIYYSGIVPTGPEDVDYNSYITKMDLEGTRDDSFGNAGRLTPGPGVNILNINKARSGALDISANVFDRNICPSIIYDRFRYDASTGEAEDSFVSNGRFLEDWDCVEYFLVSGIEGPSGELLATFNDTISESESHVIMIKFLSDGSMDEDFAGTGELNLTTLLGHRPYSFLMDATCNLYVISQEATETKNFVHVSKLKAEKIWDTVEPEASFPYSFELFPNPSFQTPYIKYVGTNISEATVQVYDAVGQLVSNKFLTSLKDGAQLTVSEEGLTPGGYVVKIFDRAGWVNSVQKFVVVE